MSISGSRSRFAGNFDEATITRPEERVDEAKCACGCGGPGCWDPDSYISDRRPSQALADHYDAVIALVAAAGGSGTHPGGSAALGDDVAGDELVLHAWFDVQPGSVAANTLATALEELLDVGVTVTPHARPPRCDVEARWSVG